MRFTSTAAILLAAESTKAISMQAKASAKRSGYNSPLAHTPVTKTMLAGSHISQRANYLKSHRSELVQLPANTKSLVQTKAKEESDVMLTTTSLEPVPSNANMGNSPTYMVVKRGDMLPGSGWFLPTQSFVEEHELDLIQDANAIGPWAIVSYYGGKMEGSGYGSLLPTPVPLVIVQVNDDMAADYYVQDDPSISDILIVQADYTDPDTFVPGITEATDVADLCDHSDIGYDCECTRKPAVDPFTRKPTFEGCPDYVDYGRDVAAFETVQVSYGYDGAAGNFWSPIPDGYWGYWLYLDQPNLWGYGDWEEWQFGVKIRDDSGATVDWCPVAGVNELTEEGDYVYRYIFKIPDMDTTEGDIEVGDCFTPIYYDGTLLHGGYNPTMAEQYDVHEFCIGTPYLASVDFYSTIIGILFDFADSDLDNCATYDEFVGIIQWANTAADDELTTAVTSAFGMCDSDGTGTLTWAELNTCLDNVGADESTADMMIVLFQYFDVMAEEEGTFDQRLTEDEMVAGMDGIKDYVRDLLSEFNFYWYYFDLSQDECISLPEFEEGLGKVTEVTTETITTFWINYYMTTFQVTEYWWWIFHLPNGGFDWDGYNRRVADGPALDGSIYFYQNDDSSVSLAYMWFLNNQCYFSLDTFDNADAARSGECAIPGHKTLSYDYDLSTVTFNFANNPSHSVEMVWQMGEWGPTGEHTDMRFYYPGNMDYGESWLWERTDEYCAACDSGDAGYPDQSYWADDTEYSYRQEYTTEEPDTVISGGGSSTETYTDVDIDIGSETTEETTITTTDLDTGEVTEEVTSEVIDDEYYGGYYY